MHLFKKMSLNDLIWNNILRGWLNCLLPLKFQTLTVSFGNLTYFPLLGFTPLWKYFCPPMGLPSDATANLSNSASLGPSYMQYAVKKRQVSSDATPPLDGASVVAVWHCTILRPLAGNVKVGKTQNLIIQSKQSSPTLSLLINYVQKLQKCILSQYLPRFANFKTVLLMCHYKYWSLIKFQIKKLINLLCNRQRNLMVCHFQNSFVEVSSQVLRIDSWSNSK